MTSALVTSESPSLSDPAAFRSVFGTQDATILLILASPEEGEALRGILRDLEELRRKGVKVQPIIFGNGAPDGIAVLESWARPLLPAVLATVNAVLVLGPDSERLLEECRADGAKTPVVLQAVDEIRALLPGVQRPSTAGRFILQNDWGIGDELLLSGVAREILRAHPGAEVWIRSRFGFPFPKYVRRDPPPADARVIETIYQNPTLYGPGAHSPFPRHLVQQMLDKVALDTGLVTNALDVRPELEIGPARARDRATVIVHSRPNPRLLSKDWGIHRWQELVRFLSAAGVRVRQVGGREEPLLEGVEDLRGAPVHELSDVFARSSAVACVVGFLMHLAEATRTPAVVIYGGREHPAIDGYSDQVHLSSQPLACRGRWGCHLGPDLECPHGMKCMEHLTPRLVASEVLSVLSEGETR